MKWVESVLCGGSAIKLLEDDADTMVSEVFKMCRLPPKHRRFPGPDCVALSRSRLLHIVNTGYVICEKSDGERCMLVCKTVKGHNMVLLVTRKLDVYVVSPIDMVTKLYEGTVLDGELVFDNQTGRRIFLFFDAVVVAGVHVGCDSSLQARLQSACDGLKEYTPKPHDMLQIRIKVFHPVTDIKTFVEKHYDAACSRYDTDGVILTPTHMAYGHPGTNPHLYKLKFGRSNTIDFIVRGKDRRDLCVAQTIGDKRVESVVARLGASHYYEDGDVVECRQDEHGAWQPERLRTDKTTPNDIVTYKRTLQCIRESLSLEDIQRVVDGQNLTGH